MTQTGSILYLFLFTTRQVLLKGVKAPLFKVWEKQKATSEHTLLIKLRSADVIEIYFSCCCVNERSLSL